MMKKVLIGAGLVIAALVGIYICICLGTEITVKGGDVSIEAGEDYEDLGYEVTLFGKRQDVSVDFDDNVDSTVPGKYVIEYNIRWNPLKKAEKVVEVRPNCDPEASGGTFIKGIILVNRKHPVSKDYAPGVNKIAEKALHQLQAAAKKEGMKLPLQDGFRSYETQKKLHRFWLETTGEVQRNMYSAAEGHSEHQTGLAFDVGLADPVFDGWPEAKWLEKNAHKFGFIIRYPKGKEEITGYAYEPWHIRYVGTTIAGEIYAEGQTLEEYLGDI